MNTMGMPGFTAEACVGPGISAYQRKAVFDGQDISGVIRMQGIGPLPRFSWENHGDPSSVFPQKRCCQYSIITKRIECTSEVELWGFTCKCYRTLTFPFILCRPIGWVSI
jgi:hypothetical protein